MILVGNQRGGGNALALHLLSPENERAQVHDLRGFAADDLRGALCEAYALSRGTKCQQYLYSLSLNPPPNEHVETAAFENAIDRAEAKLGLTGQPRAIVFHEKGGRRHAHAVWSRIDTEEMKAVPLPHTKRKLQDLGRELYREHGWDMPRGFARSSERDPRNFTLDEWQHAKRIGKDPREIKRALQDAWAISDNRAAFDHALTERGYRLARGDRRSFVAVDAHGEVYAVPKWTGVKTKDVRARLGDESTVRSVDQAKRDIAAGMLRAIDRMQQEVANRETEIVSVHRQVRIDVAKGQRAERAAQVKTQDERASQESRERQARFRTGVAGLWDRLRGQHKKTAERNQREADAAQRRDQAERKTLVDRQLAQRREQKSQLDERLQPVKDIKQSLAKDHARFAQDAKPARERSEPTKISPQRQASVNAANRSPPDRTIRKQDTNPQPDTKRDGADMERERRKSAFREGRRSMPERARYRPSRDR